MTYKLIGYTNACPLIMGTFDPQSSYGQVNLVIRLYYVYYKAARVFMSVYGNLKQYIGTSRGHVILWSLFIGGLNG